LDLPKNGLEHGDHESRALDGAEPAEIRESLLEERLACALEALGRNAEGMKTASMDAHWKVAVAWLLREPYLAPHGWIAFNLHVAKPSSIQGLISRNRSGPKGGTGKNFKNHENLA